MSDLAYTIKEYIFWPSDVHMCYLTQLKSTFLDMMSKAYTIKENICLFDVMLKIILLDVMSFWPSLHN